MNTATAAELLQPLYGMNNSCTPMAVSRMFKLWSPFSETQKGQVQHLVYSMSWTLLVSCNSFKLKINPENDHAIGGARLRITKYLKLPSSAKQCSTWSSDPAPKLGGWSLCGQSGFASRLECAKSGNHFRTPPSNVAWAAWGTTWNNLLQLEVSVCLRVSLSRQNG